MVGGSERPGREVRRKSSREGTGRHEDGRLGRADAHSGATIVR